MNTEIDITCDRCGKTVHGLIIQEEGMPKITGGFYDVTNDFGWGQFRRGNWEENVCDICMWSDPRFLAEYPGPNRKIPQL